MQAKIKKTQNKPKHNLKPNRKTPPPPKKKEIR